MEELLRGSGEHDGLIFELIFDGVVVTLLDWDSATATGASRSRVGSFLLGCSRWFSGRLLGTHDVGGGDMDSGSSGIVVTP